MATWNSVQSAGVDIPGFGAAAVPSALRCSTAHPHEPLQHQFIISVCAGVKAGCSLESRAADWIALAPTTARSSAELQPWQQHGPHNDK